jgi:HK97 family phage major capsid protein
VAESAWEWGKLGYVATGVAGELPADAPSDVLIDTVYALKAGYRQNASWVMNRRTQAAIRKLKDEDGNYLWQPPAMPGGRAMLMGFGLVEAEDMPDIATDAAPIAFGDFRRGYLVVDRAGVRVLRDPYSAKPYVLFYTTKRVGGGVQDFDAIKLMVIEPSHYVVDAVSRPARLMLRGSRQWQRPGRQLNGIGIRVRPDTGRRRMPCQHHSARRC